MDRIARVMGYAAQRYGDTPETAQRVLDAFAAGTERELMTRRQRRRDRHHVNNPQGAHRKGQRARRRERELRQAGLREAELLARPAGDGPPAALAREAAKA